MELDIINMAKIQYAVGNNLNQNPELWGLFVALNSDYPSGSYSMHNLPYIHIYGLDTVFLYGIEQ